MKSFNGYLNRYTLLIIGVCCLIGALRMLDQYPHPSWLQAFLILFAFFTGVVSLYDFVRFRRFDNDDENHTEASR